MKYLLLLTLPLLLAGCGGQDPISQEGPPEPADLLTLSPDAGFPGSIITIAGRDFGSDSSRVVVLFGYEDTARVLSVRPDQIRAVVPQTFFGQEVHVIVNGVFRGYHPHEFRVCTMLDTSYSRVSFDVKGIEYGTMASVAGQAEPGEPLLFEHATTFSSGVGARYGGGEIVVRSTELLGEATREYVLSLDPYIGTDSLKLELTDTETTGGPGEIRSQIRRVIRLRNAPYRLSADGTVTCALSGDALRAALVSAQLIEYRSNGTSSTQVNTTGDPSFHPDASLNVMISPK